MSDEIKKINVRLNNVEHKMDKLQSSFDNHFGELKNGSKFNRKEKLAFYTILAGTLVEIVKVIAPLVLG